MMESVTTTNVGDDEEVKYIQAIPNETEFLEWQSKRICENCKWWDRVDELDIGECLTVNYCHSYEDAVFKPQEDFGCNQWEKKD